MTNLIKVTNKIIGEETQKTANARELWEFLEVKQKFSDWIKNQIETFGLEENTDYSSFNKKVKRKIGGSLATEYIITLDIAMASRTQKGKEVRQYFIEVEKKYQNKLKENIRANVAWQITNEYKELSEKVENIESAVSNYIKAQIQINQQIALTVELMEAINAEAQNKSIALLLQKTNETKDFIYKLFNKFLDNRILSENTIIIKDILEAGNRGEIYQREEKDN